MQALKVLLKEKEKQEVQLVNEIQVLKEKNANHEINNRKLQTEIDSVLLKFNELSNDSEKYVSYLRSTEEQLNISEKKREDLKVDAQETIKL